MRGKDRLGKKKERGGMMDPKFVEKEEEGLSFQESERRGKEFGD